jgi:hypothetical protein
MHSGDFLSKTGQACIMDVLVTELNSSSSVGEGTPACKKEHRATAHEVILFNGRL